MKHITELSFLALVAFCSTSQAHYVEIPSDLRYPCHSYAYDQEPLDEPFTPDDARTKRQPKPSLAERVNKVKNQCAADWGIPQDKIPDNLLKVDKASPQEKCLMACVLQRLEMMTCDNLVSIKAIEQMANEVGNRNPLVTSVAVAVAEKYNNRLAALKITDQCEAAFLINRYLGKELLERRVSIKGIL